MASEAEILDQLNLGASRAIVDNKAQSPLGELLINLSEDIISQLQTKLDEYNINTSSKGLSQSLAPTEVFIDSGTISVGITAEFYWKYINYGVNGTEISHGAPNFGPAPPGEKSFKEAIIEWIPQRGLTLPEQFSSFDQFAEAIMWNVRKKGKVARPFFSDVVNEGIIDNLKEPIEKVFGTALKIAIIEPWQ